MHSLDQVSLSGALINEKGTGGGEYNFNPLVD